MQQMNTEEEYISQEKREELEQELIDLKGPRRKEILDSLEFSKSLGDLSENAEYHQAREDQRKLEERIVKIERILKDFTVIKKHHSDKVETGTTVVVQKEGSKEHRSFQIVGSEEADMAQGKISNKSPLGIALYGRKKEDIVSFESPNGVIKYKIIDIE